jgi:hypothetical protein
VIRIRQADVQKRGVAQYVDPATAPKILLSVVMVPIAAGDGSSATRGTSVFDDTR